MARSINKLSSLQVKNLSKPGMYSDGGNLWLQISSSGAKSWILRFRLHGKSREMGLGACKTISLSEARQRATECRKQLQSGIDPIEHRNQERQKQKLEKDKSVTFKKCMEAYLKAHNAKWKNKKHAAQWESTLIKHALPTLGDIPVSEIDIHLIQKCLDPIWYDITETASRVRGRIESVLDWAKVKGYRQGENPACWKGHLDQVYPSPASLKDEKHFAALPYKEIYDFITSLRKRKGVAARALEFKILTAVRSNELIGARWDEIDLQAKTWTIPASRMKAGKEHRVPLSDQAISVLKEMANIRYNEFVFPGARENKPISDASVSEVLKRMKRKDITKHGFRSTFRDWAAEMTHFPNQVAEMALAHTIGDKVEAAYRRGDLFEKRRKLMEAWANYCDTKIAKHENILKLTKGA